MSFRLIFALTEDGLLRLWQSSHQWRDFFSRPVVRLMIAPFHMEGEHERIFDIWRSSLANGRAACMASIVVSPRTWIGNRLSRT